MQFQYQPLRQGSKTIRVLDLHPGRKGDPIICSLEECSFPPTDMEAYEPLSYCWGDGREQASITVNNCSIKITSNLHAALIQLRLEKEERRLWIDAICINQDDDLEKIAQVQMMREIYQQGSQTLVWLGPGTRTLSQGFSAIHRLVKGPDKEGSRWLHDFRIGNFFPQFRAVFELPYFSRVWVIQEIAVSSSIEVFCGQKSVSWDGLEHAAREYFNYANLSVLQPFLGRFWEISEARARVKEKVSPDLLYVLECHRVTSATQSKDKIYALLGLLDSEDLARYGIVPNYRDAYGNEEAYIDAAVSVLRTSGNLNLLSVPARVASTSTSLLLPTWVPDWSGPPISEPLISFSEEPCFTATGSSICRPVFRGKEQRTVGLLGYIFDEVDSIGHAVSDRTAIIARWEGKRVVHVSAVVHAWNDTFQLWRREIESLRTWKNWIRMTCGSSRKTYVTGEPLVDVFWKTFMGICSHDTDQLETHLEEYEERVGHRVDPTEISFRPAIWVAYHAARNLAMPYRAKRPFNRIEGRRMLTTKETYFGLGPKNTQKGDFLAFLEGGQVPYVLRQKGDTYQLVGDCYIHGVMEGELYDKTRCERIWLV